MCLQTVAFIADCDKFMKAGGLAALYTANVEEVTSITQSVPNGEFDTIVMAPGKVWFKMDFSTNSASVTQTFDGANNTNTQTAIFSLPTYSSIVKKLYAELAFAKLYVIAEGRDKKRYLLGLNTSGLEATNIETNTGTNLTDVNRTTFTLSTIGEQIEIFSSTAAIPLV